MAVEEGTAPTREQDVTAVVFDLGGVLIDWNPRYLYRRVFDNDERAMEIFLATVCTAEWHYQHDLGRPMSETCAELATANSEHAGLIWAWRDRAGEMIGDAIGGSVDVLRELSDAGTPCYALSNWPAETFGLCRGRFEFLSLFTGVVISGEEGVAKPDPAIFDLLLERFGLAPAATLFVDDSQTHLATAHSLGMPTVLFDTPEGLRQGLVAAGLLPRPAQRR
jgi:2-haloacid dehalogenase